MLTQAAPFLFLLSRFPFNLNGITLARYRYPSSPPSENIVHATVEEYQ